MFYIKKSCGYLYFTLRNIVIIIITILCISLFHCYKGIAILSGGLVGMIVARRGFFRKLIFGSIGATAVAANVYPEEYKKYKTETKTVVCATVKTATGEWKLIVLLTYILSSLWSFRR